MITDNRYQNWKKETNQKKKCFLYLVTFLLDPFFAKTRREVQFSPPADGRIIKSDSPPPLLFTLLLTLLFKATFGANDAFFFHVRFFAKNHASPYFGFFVCEDGSSQWTIYSGWVGTNWKPMLTKKKYEIPYVGCTSRWKKEQKAAAAGDRWSVLSIE